LQPPKQEKPASTRPSLLSGSDTPGADEVRILNSISDTKSSGRASAPAARGKGGRIAAVAVLLLLLIGAGALVLNGRSEPGAPVAAAPEAKPVAPLAAAEPNPNPNLARPRPRHRRRQRPAPTPRSSTTPVPAARSLSRLPRLPARPS
jgi:hypothetical protein